MPSAAPQPPSAIADLDADDALSQLAAALDVKVAQRSLARALAIVAPAAARRSFSPVLECVRIEASEVQPGTLESGLLRLTCTDLEMTLETEIRASVTRAGVLIVPVGLLTNLVTALPDGPVALQGDRHALKLKAGRGVHRIKGYDAEEFPPTVWAKPDDFSWSWSTAGLHEVITRVGFVPAVDDARAHLTAVCFRGIPGMLGWSAEASDGYRIAILPRFDSGETMTPEAGPATLLVPARRLATLARHLDDKPDKSARGEAPDDEESLSKWAGCGVDKHRNGVWITLPATLARGPIRARIRLLASEYPDLKRTVPAVHGCTAVVSRAALRAAVKRILLFVTEDMGSLSIDAGDDSIRIIATSENGGASEEVGATVTGGPAHVLMGAKFLSEFLEAMPTDDVQISLGTPMGPITLRPSPDLPDDPDTSPLTGYVQCAAAMAPQP